MRRYLPAIMVLTALFSLITAPNTLYAGTTERVSVASDGMQGDYGGEESSISADGRFVAFKSYASNLVSGDTNGANDVFVHDRVTGVTERVSVASDGTQGNNESYAPSISADGRFVAFKSYASNLVSGDTNGDYDVFVHDRITGITERVSVASDGTQGNNESYYLSISADGRFVAFDSYASNLTSGDRNGNYDVFVHDRVTGVTEVVSVASDGTQGNNGSYYPSISADGRFVAFQSYASNLVSGDTNGTLDVFVHDRVTGVTEVVSMASDGTQGNNDSCYPSISADGRFVAFHSRASNLAPGATGGPCEVFMHDRVTGVTEVVSVASDGTPGNNDSCYPSISADGRFVAFQSRAPNLLPGDTSGDYDVFVHDRVTAVTEKVSVASDGTQGNHTSELPSISADGRFVAFMSLASNLVPGDTNSAYDVFVHDRLNGTWTFPPGTEIGASNPYTPPPSTTETLHRLRGAIHTHWYDDNGLFPPGKPLNLFSWPPSLVEGTYKSLGYDFIALTEHQHLTPWNVASRVTGPDFVHIENCEEINAPGYSGHMLAIGVDGNSSVGVNDPWDRPIVFPLDWYDATPSPCEIPYDWDMQRRVDGIESMGGLALLPHPASTFRNGHYSVEEMMALEDYTATAIRTAASYADAVDRWDELLRGSKGTQASVDGVTRYIPILGYSEEDFTPGLAAPGSTWMLLDAYYDDSIWNATTTTNKYRSDTVVAALKSGRWWSYWSPTSIPWMGWSPKLDISITHSLSGDQILVKSDTVLDKIHFIGVRSGGQKSGDLQPVAQNVSTASYAYSGGEKYVRILAEYNAAGRRLYIASQPMWVYPMGLVIGPYGDTGSPARISVRKPGGLSTMETSPGLVLNYVIPDDLPSASPSLGYIRYVYDISSETGSCPSDAQLTLSYAGEDVTMFGEHNLRIFHYDGTSSTWIPLASTLDSTNQELTAPITELGLYTISAVPQADTEPPTVSMVLPVEGSTITDTAQVMANATDNVGVAQVTFYLGDRQIATDSTGIDSWLQEVDFSHYVSGNYVLTAEAEDLKGNRATATRNIVLQTNAVAPTLSITTPLPRTAPTDPVTIAGTVTDADGFVAGVTLEINGSLVGVADITDNQWTCALDKALFGNGNYTLVTKATDDYGNVTTVTTSVTTNNSPSNTSLAPNSGWTTPGVKKTFACKYSDPDGYGDIAYCYLLLNKTVGSAANSVYAVYNQKVNLLYLRNDANTGWVGGFAPGSNNTIENAECKIYCAETTVSGSGNDITVNWCIQPKSTMSGRAWMEWLMVTDKAGASDGWDKMGAVVVDSPPADISLTPAGDWTHAVRKRMSCQYSDPDGYGDIAYAFLLVNKTYGSGANSVYAVYNQKVNLLYLRNDANTMWIGGFVPGSANTMENAECKMFCADTTITKSGNTLTVNWSILPKSGMMGTGWMEWMMVTDRVGLSDGWDYYGTNTVQ